LNSFDVDNASCWQFSNKDPVPFATIPITIEKPNNSDFVSVDCKVDTGFNGVIGLPNLYIHELGLIETGTIKIRTASGETFIPYYNGIISLKSTKLTNLKAIILKTPRPIVGRTLINLGSWLYDGPNQKWCLL
jgi:predicted aspartyl protease